MYLNSIIQLTQDDNAVNLKFIIWKTPKEKKRKEKKQEHSNIMQCNCRDKHIPNIVSTPPYMCIRAHLLTCKTRL